MYFYQAMRDPDRKEFLNATIKEVNIHCERKHWKLIPHSGVPKVQFILDSVWDMNINRYIVTRKVYKWKAIFNVHGGQK